MSKSQYRFAFDIGGTFTDLVLLGPGNVVFAGKCLTTPDIDRSVIAGLRALLEEHAIDPGAIGEVVSGGTTLVTNLIIERKGARTGLITTSGFADVIEIGREIRYDNYDLRARRPDPLVPRELRFEVDERLDARGTVLRPLDEASVERAVAAIEAQGCRTVAVCLLHSYRSPLHEERIRDIIAVRSPGMSVSLSSEILPEIREYERTVATVLNAYVQPFVGQYLATLEEALRRLGINANLYVMQSNGGVISREFAERVPLRMLESGPAAGALAAADLSKGTDLQDVVAFDMGGTTAKACVITRNEPSITTEFETARAHRFKKGSGFPVRLPVIDLIEIGAGGGSIAYTDEKGLMKVGPRSAGAEPGPACYGSGGELPTVTDADLLLGYLAAESFLGGKMPLYREAAERAVSVHLCKPLGLSLEEAASGVYRIVGESMAAAMKIHAAEKGVDIRHYALIAFGGAGPVHAREVARRLHVQRIIVPNNSGVLSAVGLLVAPVRFDSVRTHYAKVAEVDWPSVNAIWSELGGEAAEVLGRMGIGTADTILMKSADMRYVGQGYEVTVPMPESARSGAARTQQLVKAFHEVYAERFGHFLKDAPAEILSWRVNALHWNHGTSRNGSRDGRVRASHPKPHSTRRVYDQERKRFVSAHVFRYSELRSGDKIAGPAVIEQVESTAVIGRGDTCTVDNHGNLHLAIARIGATG